MKTFLRLLTLCVMLSLAGGMAAKDIVWHSPKAPAGTELLTPTDPVVRSAAGMLSSDLEAVTGAGLSPSAATIRVAQLDKADASTLKELKKKGIPVDNLKGLADGMHLGVHGGKIYAVGANGRGTAYALLELSRLAGVSPWIWWGDLVPEKRPELAIDSRYSKTHGASVEYRGIFINDEDWSLRPWAENTHEPGRKGEIGPKTYGRIFELILRLRGNAVWPAMHPGTRAFFKTPGAKAMADSLGIVTGSSHCEPLLRNNVGEWDEATQGRFNYRTNRDEVKRYWAERLREVSGSAGGNMFTIGMRGIHDGSMEGYRTMEEKAEGLQQVIDDQQKMIAELVGKPEEQMQVFVPYKEVLELYERGVRVPPCVTLMWCDDNYGYITRLSNPEEQKRPGGGGVYYHLSYWGRPHDHLWLTTTQPGLIYNEMREAYDHNVRKLWIANVHDPKVAGYDLELFMDMAWDIDTVKPDGVADHYRAWLTRQFGTEAGAKIHPAMTEFYRLTAQRKPEFMGWSQTELDKRLYLRGLSPVTNTEFSGRFGGEADRYIERWDSIGAIVSEAKADLRPELADAYFAAVEYPVLAAGAHTRKMLYAQKARETASGGSTADLDTRDSLVNLYSALSQKAYQEVRALTAWYNDSMASGKWRRSMDMRPRDLPFGSAPVLPVMLTDAETGRYAVRDSKKYPVEMEGAVVLDAADFTASEGGHRAVDMLGHSMKAVALDKGASLTYKFTLDNPAEGVLRIAMIPTQPNDGGDLRYEVSIDGGEPTVFSLKEPFRSEGWKQNVLRGQALRSVPVSLAPGEHTVSIKALDPHIVADQLMIDPDPARKFYLFPR